MHRLILAIATILNAVTPSSAQTVPDGIYRRADGPAKMCGLIGRNATDVLAQARQSPDFRVIPNLSSDRFEMFETIRGEPFKFQLVATRPSEPAFPAVTCRELYQGGGGLRMTRTMQCDADRAACDALFLEFQAFDAQLTQTLRDLKE
ncbi:hypothetical protein [Bosea sp. (in: a-proteobacteria)]|uniref:hypothetical protein n=1 Tax=Bosea sp. (in: a-proteobacteria) TaxID=1871050 RepID=UPI002B485535|nr:hypothetical protein [Bosea sp. (in: a-proteobacteria)]WRH59723.1 MAG: hypothetical protein RSE11_08095 [Bosea sp. (in: a-proteobacteria)]